MNRADGYNSGDFEFQGVRVHDDTSSQWLAPDAYGRNVSDPMSQNPFIWNGNNPVEYSDPSGYVSVEATPDPRPNAPPATVRCNANCGKRVREQIESAAIAVVAAVVTIVDIALHEPPTAAETDSITMDQAAELGSAALRKGNFDLESGTAAEANAMGRQWLGKGYKTSANGTLTSADGLRTYRPPALKAAGVAAGKVQANFEWRTRRGSIYVGNGHMTIGKP